MTEQEPRNKQNEIKKEPPKDPMYKTIVVLFELEEQIAKGNISEELLSAVATTAYNQSWGEDIIVQ